jgi:streptomycin 6-kinase
MAAVATLRVPSSLVAAAAKEEGRGPWLRELPAQIEALAARWSLALGDPFEPGGWTAWVAPAHSATYGDAVLKVGWRHMEAENEADGLREWDGEGTVRVFADERLSETTAALLLERCVPGTLLRGRSENEQDVVIAGLLRRLWRAPAQPDVFRPLSVMCDYWADSFERKVSAGPNLVEPALAREGAALFRSLAVPARDDVLLCTDLHAGNVLAAGREEWLVIDPKPFVGDPTYDALQHLLNCRDRLLADPLGLVARVAGLLDLDADRLRTWLFARCVVETDTSPWALEVARAVRPG